MGSLCTGYGGLDLGVLAALGGGRIAWVADPDPHIAQILAARLPGIPNLGDLRHIDWTVIEPVDVLVAGFPCQDISAAGRRVGIEKGTRSGLWTDIVAGLRVLRPAFIVVENVAALRWKGGGLHRVLGDLAEAGYDALWRSVRAADIGAAHRRERVFLLAWRRDAAGADAAHSTGARRRPPRAGGPGAPAGARTPGELARRGQRLRHAAADPDSIGCEELHAPDSDWRAFAARRGAAAADPASLGLWDGGPQQGRPDPSLGGHPPAHPAGAQLTRRQRDRRHLVAVPNADTETGPASGAEATPVNWGVYEAAIRRWEAVLGRPTPYPTRPGNHGRPILAPAFVEHLMGLAEGWVTDLALPRTAQLRALGNGVVPQQAGYAVALLLDDFAELLNISTDTDDRSQTGQEVTAA